MRSRGLSCAPEGALEEAPAALVIDEAARSKEEKRGTTWGAESCRGLLSGDQIHVNVLMWLPFWGAHETTPTGQPQTAAAASAMSLNATSSVPVSSILYDLSAAMHACSKPDRHGAPTPEKVCDDRAAPGCFGKEATEHSDSLSSKSDHPVSERPDEEVVLDLCVGNKIQL